MHICTLAYSYLNIDVTTQKGPSISQSTTSAGGCVFILSYGTCSTFVPSCM